MPPIRGDVTQSTPKPELRMPVADLLAFKSSEATLLHCTRGHIAGHPNTCPDGCTFTDLGETPRTVADIVTLRIAQYATGNCAEWDGNAAPLTVPVTVEDGWLLDGHHRVAVAYRDGVADLPVRTVTGLLQQIREHHLNVRTLAATHPGEVPPHRPTKSPTGSGRTDR